MMLRSQGAVLQGADGGANRGASVRRLESSVLLVIVLYKVAPEQSQAFRSLREHLDTLPGASDGIQVLLYDNSPEPSAAPEVPFPCTYVHDPTNPGLAHPYNTGLQQAERNGIGWLGLLDQDTVVTREYFEEVLATAQAVQGDTSIVALAPKLIQPGHVLSPHWSLLHPKSVLMTSSGVIEGKVHVFNSGAILRVDAMTGIGGFDEAFPLDYLDHTTFFQLQEKGGRIFLLKSALQHELSQTDPRRFDSPAFVRRYWPSLEAEHRYYVRYATREEMFWHYDRRFRMLLGLLARFKLRSALRHVRYSIGS